MTHKISKHNRSTLHRLYFAALALMLILTSLGLQPVPVQAQPAPAVDMQTGINAGWWGQAQEYIRQSEYHIAWVDESQSNGAPGGFQAPNRAQGLRIYFQPQGLHIIERTLEKPSWAWDMALSEVDHAGLSVEANRIVYQRSKLLETYINSEHGLVQIFELAAPARLRLRITSDLELRRRADGGLEWQRDDLPMIQYGNLGAIDAHGRSLAVQVASLQAIPAQNAAPSGPASYTLELAVEDQSAAYPLQIQAAITGLSTEVQWIETGLQEEAFLGVSVATAGDVNGDGYSDVIVSAPWFDTPDTEAGMVWVYHGTPIGLLHTANWGWQGERAGDHFGMSAATAGDVNGDGFSDVIIGAPDWEASEALPSQGKVYGFYGANTGLPIATVNWSAQGDVASSGMGLENTIATAGDFNGDGFSDVVVGIRNQHDVSATYGIAEIYYGSESGLPGENQDWAWGEQENCQMGYSVSTAGDVNGDGYADLLVSAPSFDSDGKTDKGRVYLFYGSNGGFNDEYSTILSGSAAYDAYGTSVSTAGDVNGDGYADVLIGAPQADGAGYDRGYVYAYYGSGSGLVTSIAWYVVGDQDYGMFGDSIAVAGDVNGDGYADILIGQANYIGSGSYPGRALLWLGGGDGLGQFSNTPATADWQAVVTSTNDSLFGYSVATAGDVNGDGYSDVIIGGPRYTGNREHQGIVQVYHGGPDNLSSTPGWSYTGAYTNINVGYSLATAGDVNGDGYADVIAGAPYYDSSFADEGAIFVWYGSDSSYGLSSAPNWWAIASGPGARLGHSVASAGDVNGDGYDDIIAGAPSFNNGSLGEGMAFIWMGSSSGLGAAGSFANADWKAESNNFDAALGYSVAGAGDVNGDGYADVIVGAPYYDWLQTNSGRVLVWYGRSGGPTPNGNPNNSNWAYSPNIANAKLGLSVAGAGDANRDGYSDVIAGGEGRAMAWYGSYTGIGANPNWSVSHASNQLGASVATAGDVNGDGYSEVIVGAPLAGSSQEGMAFVYCGSSGGLSVSNCWSATGSSANAKFGAAVATAGDVNGDGFADILVGSPTWTNSETEKGRVHLYYGSLAGLAPGSGDWQYGSTTTYAKLGAAVASAGDFNGDGYADILIGAPGISSASGQMHMFYGNGTPGRAILPLQTQVLGTPPIARLGMTSTTWGFWVKAFGVSPTGKGLCKLQLEVKQLQQVFNGLYLDTTSSWLVTPTPGGLPITVTHYYLDYGRPYHWRVRIQHSPVTNPFDPPRSRWYHIPWNGWNEADLRSPYAMIYLPLIRK